ncbi:sugar phosphate isomerase/epimerase family protein [Lachnotalea glycerini]|uniref:Sugar phosphate isomerase/epimerase n=1 Tax=Lachnotalea glycerini TaxID=1763509 RepID=A0A371JFM7_9FIRM|nr:sugar phosphate isomerase/epimerase [Lachnotalea glycerini]RDY31564.1 sugar phosphate isomerase/epimerase [Lachnotalea glycerini]
MLKNAIITGFADEIHRDVEVQVKLMKELGISYLELRSANGKSIADYTLEEAKALKKYLKENQINVSAIGSPIGKIQITDEFESHFNVFKNVVEIAKIMETPYIRMFSFFIPEGENPENYSKEVFARMKRMVDYAKEQKVVLLHENEKGIYGAMALQCQKLFESFYGDNFKATFDFANFVQCKQETVEAYEMLKPYIEYIHIKDALWDNGKVVPAAQGDGNVKEILQKLDQEGYCGFLSLEPHLTEFEGLKNLEKNPEKRELTDGEAAYTIAYQALMKLIK